MKKILLLLTLSLPAFAQQPYLLANGWLTGPVTPTTCSSGNSPTFYNYASFVLFDCTNNLYHSRSIGGNVNWITDITNKPVIDVRTYGTDTTGFTNAVAAAANGTLLVQTSVSLSSSVSVPSNVSLLMLNGGVINISGSNILTVNGPFAGDYSQHFSGSGVTVLNQVPEHFVQWWGAKGNMISANNGAMTNGSNVLTATGFTPDVVGRSIVVFGVDIGPSGYINTTITGFINSNQVSVGMVATVTNSSAGFTYGTDDTAAINATVDSIVAGGQLNAIQHAPAGVAKFLPASYWISNTVSPCHYNGCPGGPGVPAGLMNVGLSLDGGDRGAVTLYSAAPNIDMIDMYMWSAPSSVKNMTIESSGAGVVNIKVKGNLTTLSNLWMFGEKNIVLSEQDLATGVSATQIYDIVFDSPFGVGGPGKGITGEYNPAAGDPLAMNAFTIDRIQCFAGSYCIYFNAIHNSSISNVVGELQGQFGIQIANGDNVNLSNINLRSTNNNSGILSTDDGIEIITSKNITLSSPVITNFSGPAIRVDTSTGVVITGAELEDNVLDATTTFRQDVYAVSSDVTLIGGTITNNNGHPTNAVKDVDSGFNGSYGLEGVAVTGSAYTGTLLDFTSGGNRVDLSNNYFKNINSGAATPTIIIGPTAIANVAGNVILQSGSPTLWLQSTSASTNLLLGKNFPNHGNVSINGVSKSTFTTGMFSGSTAIDMGNFSNIQAITGFLSAPVDQAGAIVTTDGTQTLINKNFSILPGGILHAACWKTGGLPGYCSTVVAADGSCTCN